MLKKGYAYMIRNDGKIFEFSDWHPYIKQWQNDDPIYTLRQLLTENAYYLKWLYDNTLKETTKESILRFIKAFMASTIGDILGKGYYDINSNEVRSYFPNLKYSEEDIVSEELFIDEMEVINHNMNQEFLRVRTSDAYNIGSNNKDIYFRIGSIGFDWFNIIWKFVYNNSNDIETVTITSDEQSGKKRFVYKHNGKIIDHISTEEFLTLSGNPVFESSLNIEDEILLSGGTLFEAFPSNDHWLNKIVKNRKEKYLEEHFIEDVV